MVEELENADGPALELWICGASHKCGPSRTSSPATELEFRSSGLLGTISLLNSAGNCGDNVALIRMANRECHENELAAIRQFDVCRIVPSGASPAGLGPEFGARFERDTGK